MGGVDFMKANWIVPSLMVSNLVLWIPQLVASLLLIEIGLSFELPVGVAGQIMTSAFIVSVIMGLLMGVLSVRFRHKSLLIRGLAFLNVASLGCFLAPDFTVLLLFYSLTGVSNAVVTPISNALIGEHFAVEKRPRVIGYVFAGMALSFVVGSPIIALIGDWRSAFSLSALPLALLSLLFAFVGLPSTSGSKPSSQSGLEGFKEVFSKKSAVACILANVLSATSMAAGAYLVPFYRHKFLLDTAFLSFVYVGVSLINILGSLVGGSIVNKFGRKPLTVLGTFTLGAFSMSLLNVPSLWLSFALWFLAALCGGLFMSAFSSLAIEQVPNYRGTMMSLSQVSQNMAQAIGAGLGGLILVSYNYELLSVLGIPAIVASFIFHFFTSDPTKIGS